MSLVTKMKLYRAQRKYNQAFTRVLDDALTNHDFFKIAFANAPWPEIKNEAIKPLSFMQPVRELDPQYSQTQKSPKRALKLGENAGY